MARYKNSWHKPSQPMYGPEFYETDAKPVEVNGCQIYQRIHGQVWDVVKDGVCLTQRAGPRGARDYIDSLDGA